jgi:nicotinate-nucleotide adenylyltransferase
MNYNIGILGGSFNPIHIGHITMCQYVSDELNLNKVYLMPNENPPHKTNENMLSGLIRLKMCELVIANNKFLDVIDYEIGNKNKNYTIDTLKKLLKNEFKNKNIYFIIGADSLMNIETWKNYEELLELINIVCIMRPKASFSEVNKKIDEINGKFNNKVIVVKMPLIQISSTSIRNRIRNNKSVKHMLDADVLKYINEMNYYK